MTDAPRNPILIIDDLGFRMAWLEKTVQMNILRLEALAGSHGENIQQQLRDLAADTRESLTQLQVHAVERMLVQNREPAKVLPFARTSTSDKSPRPGMVPA